MRSSPKRWTASSPAGIPPPNACSDTPRRRRSAAKSPSSCRSRCAARPGKFWTGYAPEKIEYRETVRVDRNRRWIDVSLGIAPIRAQSGAIIGAAKVVRDITAEKIAQAALLESQQMARDIIENSLDAFIQTDAAGNILEWNPQAEAILGWSRQEALGKHLAGLILPEALQPHRRMMRELMLRNEENALTGDRFEIDAIRKDGQVVKIEVSLKLLRRVSGSVFNSFIRDLEHSGSRPRSSCGRPRRWKRSVS